MPEPRDDNFIDSEARIRQKKRTQDEERLHIREVNDTLKVLKTPEGRRFIWHIISLAGIFRDPFTANANTTGYLCGRQSIGRDLLIDLEEADPNAFFRMHQEYVSEKNSKKEETKAKEE